MPLPAWNDPGIKAGTMVRAALWLVQQVGEGNTFTKEDLRSAFPGVSQVDRRLRDLRAYKWVILASTEDATLVSEEQRFVKTGVPVWDSEARQAGNPAKIGSAKDMQDALERDGYMCTICGISGGEPYVDDSHQTAVLSVSRRATVMAGGDEGVLLVTECKRCRAGRRNAKADAGAVLRDIQALEPADRQRLGRWIERGRRQATPLERAWSSYLRLPGEARDGIRAALDE